jgi:cold shock CspA family protein
VLAGSCQLMMKLFGTVHSFNTNKGHGEIKPEVGSDLIGFEKSAIAWDKDRLPTVGQRLSYEAGTNNAQPYALNLQTA